MSELEIIDQNFIELLPYGSFPIKESCNASEILGDALDEDDYLTASAADFLTFKIA